MYVASRTRLGPLSTTPILALLAITFFHTPSARGFSVLSHQAVVDDTWHDTLVPALRQRFPKLAARDLERARAFAHGGSHLPDLGYFPLGNTFFTELLHYVRSGDFVTTLLAEAQSPDEYAFALGVLSHFVTDVVAHPEATNQVVAEVYPKLRKKFGEKVTYADDHASHVETEFRFDVLQVAQRKRAPGLFEHALQFEVAKPVLDRAFARVYGLHLDDLFTNTDVAILTYRWGFRGLIHEATGIAWQLYRSQSDPLAGPEELVDNMSRANFEREFGRDFNEPGAFARFFAWIATLAPDIGPFKRLPYQPLPQPAQDRYRAAMAETLRRFRAAVERTRVRGWQLENRILDTGEKIAPGRYRPVDEAHAELARKLVKLHHADVDGDLRTELREFFADGTAMQSLEHRRDRRRTERALAELATSAKSPDAVARSAHQ